MSWKCSYAGCLIEEEGICSKNGTSVACDSATEVVIEITLPSVARNAPTEVNPLSKAEDSSIVLHTGEELGLEEMEELMGSEYAHVIAVLGEHDSGKTSFLMCLYLACACGQMSDIGMSFAGSLTLPGFEARSRSTRRWNHAQPPDRMTERTVLGAERSGGFLHLDLVRDASGQRVRTLLSDLPGEWTKDLIDSNRHSGRFEFTRRADALLILFNGSEISDLETRQAALYRAGTLIQRLLSVVGDSRPLLTLVMTRSDLFSAGSETLLRPIVELAIELGFDCSVRSICTFSSTPGTPSGHGVLDLFKSCLEVGITRDIYEPSEFSDSTRVFGWAPVAQDLS